MIEAAVPPAVTRRRFTVDEYHRMIEAGILTEDDRVELIEGEIVKMAAIGGRHAARVNDMNEWFLPRVIGRAIVSVQNPVRLSDGSEPEPDFMLLRPRSDGVGSSSTAGRTGTSTARRLSSIRGC